MLSIIAINMRIKDLSDSLYLIVFMKFKIDDLNL